MAVCHFIVLERPQWRLHWHPSPHPASQCTGPSGPGIPAEGLWWVGMRLVAYFGKRLHVCYHGHMCMCKHAHLYRSASQQLSMCRPRPLRSPTTVVSPTLVVLIYTIINTTRLSVSDGSGRGQSAHARGWRGAEGVVTARAGAAWRT